MMPGTRQRLAGKNPKGIPESQRDSATKPRVARDELPWVKVAGVSQPQRGCGLVTLPLPWAATLFRVVTDCTPDLQARLFLASTGLAIDEPLKRQRLAIGIS